jgi:hypothetical protein
MLAQRAVDMVGQRAHERDVVTSEQAAGGGPEGPTELSQRSWWAVLKRTVREFSKDNLSDWAAALTYYSVLSIFPAVIVLTAVLALFGSLGDPNTNRQHQHHGPRPRPGRPDHSD